MKRDQGARNLIRVFFAVVGIVGVFYGYLAWRALNWNPMFFIQNAEAGPSPIMATSEDFPKGPPVTTYPSVERGRRLYVAVGCAVCHGVDGRGLVRNPNYVKETVPALDVLAERLFLNEPEDVQIVLKRFDTGQPLHNGADLDVPRAEAVMAQYESVRTVILSGNPAGKKDPAGHEPLDMPKWGDLLTESQVNDVIAYLLSLYPWETTEQQ